MLFLLIIQVTIPSNYDATTVLCHVKSACIFFQGIVFLIGMSLNAHTVCTFSIHLLVTVKYKLLYYLGTSNGY